jgi:sugar phosphate isomerase/epimerase
LAENVPDLHIIFDTGNFCYFNEDVFEVYKKLKPYIKKNIHLKDRSQNGRPDEKPELINGKEVYIVVPGTGDIPIKEVLDDLKASGFEGGITAELFGSTDSMTDILASVEFMKQYE